MLEKFIGALVGSALGDALGKNVEDITREEIYSYYGGRIEDFVEPHPHSPAFGLEPHQTSDETTITTILLESILERKALDVRDFLTRLLRWKDQEEKHRNPDPTLLVSLELIRQGLDPRTEGIDSASVEGVLRCLAVALFHYENPYLSAEAGRLVSLLTHYGEDVYDASAVYSALISLLLQGAYDLSSLGSRLELLDFLKGMAKRERIKERLDRVKELLQSGADLDSAIMELGNSTHVLEALPLSIFIFLSNLHDPQKALFDAVNSYGELGGDTDAIGYLVGSMVGAYLGVQALPQELLEKLENLDYHILLAKKLYRMKEEKDGL